jgi:predicted house-cleaning NTP pyrophosphatase (Maf/HAM1 superfamily)
MEGQTAGSGSSSVTPGSLGMPVSVMLGSSSKFRAQLVAGAMPDGYILMPDRLSPDIDEKAIRRPLARDLVLAIAHAKADRLTEMLDAQANTGTSGDETVGPQLDPDLFICADQVIQFRDEIREKAVDAAQAKAHLQSYGNEGVPAVCVSGLVVVNRRTGKRVCGVDVATQHFERVPDDVAEALIAKGDILYCAGSFVAEDELLAPYLGKRTGEIESVQGMPIALTRELLREATIVPTSS